MFSLSSASRRRCLLLVVAGQGVDERNGDVQQLEHADVRRLGRILGGAFRCLANVDAGLALKSSQVGDALLHAGVDVLLLTWFVAVERKEGVMALYPVKRREQRGEGHEGGATAASPSAIATCTACCAVRCWHAASCSSDKLVKIASCSGRSGP